MTTPLEREIRLVAEDLRKARKRPADAAWVPILEARLAVLKDEREIQRIALQTCEEQREQVRRWEEQP